MNQKVKEDGIMLTSDANENGKRLFIWMSCYGKRKTNDTPVPKVPKVRKPIDMPRLWE